MLRLNEPGFYCNNKLSEDDLILEARWMLAVRYGNVERADEAKDCFWGGKGLSSADTLKRWDAHNQHQIDPFMLVL
jgi:hypothetical protein